MIDSKDSETIKIYSVVLSIGVVCSLAIVGVYEVTRPMIARNKITLRQDAILDVLPGAVTTKTYQFDGSTSQFQPASTDAKSELNRFVFAGFDRDNKLVGLALETQGMGYQDRIRLLYGYSPDDQAIIGIRVLESRETPGLGDRIETDANFLSNFQRLDVTLSADQSQLAHPIEFVKRGRKTDDWQVDGITGATISSRATAEMLRKSSAHWIPRVHSRRIDFAPNTGKEP